MTTAQRAYPNGKPLHLRVPEFNSKQTGRLTHSEYNVIDMATRFGITDILTLTPYLMPVDLRMDRDEMQVAYDRLVRLFNRMVHVGLVVGEPSSFRFTREGLEAFQEADRWMLYPEMRPSRVTVVVKAAGRTFRRRCWPEDAERVRAGILAELGIEAMELELVG